MPHHPFAPAAALTLALASLLLAAGCSRRDESLNVLLVTLDTTRADRLRSYGYERNTSPNLDALARDGVRFDLAIAQAAVTPVSHASILTGLNPYQHGLRVLFAGKGDRLDPSVPTLATVLRENGWQTGAFLSAFTVSEHFGFDLGFDHFDNGIAVAPDEAMAEGEDGLWHWDQRANQRRSDETTERALDWLGGRPSPFFAWVHYWDPHDPELVPPEDLVASFTTRAADENARMLGLYDAEVYYMDSQFGRLVKALKEMDLYDRTLIVVVADHGQGLGDHGWWYHRILYQEQIRVPMMIRIPGVSPGREVPELVRTIDIFPTIIDALGLEAPAPVAGRSLAPIMRGEPDAPRTAYADAINLYDLNASMLQLRPRDDLLHCAMDRSWKLIYRPTRPDASELYDLAADPAERRNLYAAEHPEAKRLHAELETAAGFVDAPLGEKLDEQTLERLKALGYIGD